MSEITVTLKSLYLKDYSVQISTTAPLLNIVRRQLPTDFPLTSVKDVVIMSEDGDSLDLNLTPQKLGLHNKQVLILAQRLQTPSYLSLSYKETDTQSSGSKSTSEGAKSQGFFASIFSKDSSKDASELCPKGHRLSVVTRTDEIFNRLVCDVCNQKPNSVSYRCLKCDFDRCEKCKEQNRITSQRILCPNQHPLTLLRDQERLKHIMCDECNKPPLQKNVGTYRCEKCNFDRCENCYT